MADAPQRRGQAAPAPYDIVDIFRSFDAHLDTLYTKVGERCGPVPIDQGPVGKQGKCPAPAPELLQDREKIVAHAFLIPAQNAAS
jgi:hypothetical protein